MTYSRFLPFSIGIFFFLLLFFSFAAYGQNKFSDAYFIKIDGDISPGNNVLASLENGNSSIQSVRSVDWYIDETKQEKYKNKLSLDVPVSNTPSFITANIIYFDILNNRQSAQIIRIIQPILFDILWEGDTITIPEYRGHKLVGPDSPVTLSAHIQYTNEFGSIFTEKDFSFRWLINFKYSKESGPGKHTITIPNAINYLSGVLNIQLDATLISDDSQTFRKNTFIPVSTPVLLAYTHSPLYGLNTRRVVSENSIILKKPLTISLYPFYFSKKDFESDLIRYNWFVNNNKNVSKMGRRIDISIEGESVRVPFKIDVQNENNSLQKITHTFSLSL